MLDHQREHGSPPTCREIQDRFRFASPNGVACHIRALIKKRWARAGVDGKSRRYLAVDPTKPDACPCCGREFEE